MLASRLERIPSHFGNARPWLLCVDLQREYVVPGRPLYESGAAPVADACRRVLEHARARRWRVVHTQQRQPQGLFSRSGHFGAPIEGLRPLISEPVFMRSGLSAFSNPDFADEARDALGEEVYLIGFSLNHTCLATAFGAIDLGLSLTLVEDAVGAAPCAGLGLGRVEEISRATLAPFVSFTRSDDLVEASATMVAGR